MKTLTQRAGLLAGFALAATLLQLPAWVAGQDKAPEKKPGAAGAPKGLRVFFADHSMLWYAPKVLNDVAAGAGIKDHKLVGQQSIGASKTMQHWQKAEGQNTAKKALKTGEVDVFVMAPIGFPDEGIDNFVKLGLEHNPNMRFHVQISWCAYDQDMNKFGKGGFAAKVDRNKTPDELMKLNADNIKTAEAQADAINKKAGKKVLFLVPSAQANVAARIKIIKKDIPVLTTQGELFADAISHPAAPLQALNTYMHFAALYSQSPVGLPMIGFLKNNKKYAEEKLNVALQEIAWETISKYPYSYPYHASKATPAEKGK